MKKSKLPSLVSILILTLLTVVMWISLSVYHAFTAKQPESVPSTVSEPLTPTLDQNAIQQIESSVFLQSSEIPEITAGGSASPTPKQSPVPTQASETPIPTVTPEAIP